MPSPLQFYRLPWLRRLSGVAVLVHLLAVVLLSAAPDLHALLHDHAHHEGHHCSITVYQDGTLNASAAAPIRTGVHAWTLLPFNEARPVQLSLSALVGGPRDRGPPENTAVL